MFRIVVILFLSLSASVWARDERLYYSVDSWDKKRNAVDELKHPQEFDWFNGLSLVQTYEVVDSLIAIAERTYPFREGEFEEWRDGLFEETYFGRKGQKNKIYYGPAFVRANWQFGTKHKIFLKSPRAIALEDSYATDKSRWPDPPHYVHRLLTTDHGEGCFEVGFKMEELQDDSSTLQDMLTEISRLQPLNGLMLDLRNCLDIPIDSLYTFVSNFLGERKPGFVRETCNAAERKILSKQDTIPDCANPYRGALVIRLSNRESGYKIAALLASRPHTTILDDLSPSCIGSSNGYWADLHDPLALPFGYQAFVANTIYRMPGTGEYVTIPEGGAAYISCGSPQLSAWREYEERPLRELRKLLEESRKGE